MNWFREEFARLDRSPKALRRFGLVVGGISALLGLVLVLRHRTPGLPLLIIGALLVIGGLFKPTTVKPLHAIWMGFALLIGSFVARVILTIVFFVVVTPIGLLQRLVGRSAVDLRFRTGAASYWQPRQKSFAPTDYRNQF